MGKRKQTISGWGRLKGSEFRADTEHRGSLGDEFSPYVAFALARANEVVDVTSKSVTAEETRPLVPLPAASAERFQRRGAGLS